MSNQKNDKGPNHLSLVDKPKENLKQRTIIVGRKFYEDFASMDCDAAVLHCYMHLRCKALKLLGWLLLASKWTDANNNAAAVLEKLNELAELSAKARKYDESAAAMIRATVELRSFNNDLAEVVAELLEKLGIHHDISTDRFGDGDEFICDVEEKPGKWPMAARHILVDLGISEPLAMDEIFTLLKIDAFEQDFL